MDAINYIHDHFSANDDDILVMHDAVRPVVTRHIIMEKYSLS